MKSLDRQAIDYVTEKINDTELLEMDRRMASDPSLLEQVQAFRFLKDNFEAIWNGLSAENYQDAPQASRLVAAVRQASELYPALRSRLQDTLEQAAISTLNEIRILQNRAKQYICLASQESADGLKSKPLLSFSGIGSPDSEIATLLKDAHQNLSKSNISEAERGLAKAAAIDPSQSTTFVIDCYQNDIRIAELRSDCQRNYLGIRYHPNKLQTHPKIAIMIPIGSTDAIKITEFDLVEEENVLLAEFYGIQEGQSRVILV